MLIRRQFRFPGR